MERRDIHEAIDACRPGSSDLGLPEMAELSKRLEDDPTTRRGFDRCQKMDQALTNVIHDVPVPVGLAARLMDAIATGGEPNTLDLPVEGHDPDASSAKVEVAGPASNRTTQSYRKSSIFGLCSLAACLAIAVVVVIASRDSGPQPNEQFASQVLSWTDVVAQSDWSKDFDADVLAAYPPDVSIRVAPLQWGQHSTPYDGHAVVYDLARPGQRHAYLFCVRTSGKDAFSTIAPVQPFSTTGGYSVAAWQRGELLYVLAVEGDARRYRQFVSPPSHLARGDRQSFLVGTIGKI